jgi:hypothetical protein
MKALVYEQPREFRKEVPVPPHLSFDGALFTESTAGAGPTGIIHPNSA